MTRSIAHSLWLRQTAYTVVVVAIVAAAVSGVEVVLSYHAERDRMQNFGNDLVDSFSDAAARAAFHVDRRQARSVVDGIMQYDELADVKITTDLGLVLAHRTRTVDGSSIKPLADWLFSDVTVFRQKLTIDRSEFVSGQQSLVNIGPTPVGDIVIHVDSAAVGRSFFYNVRALIVGLVVEFFLLATALAFIFYRTITKPLQGVAKQLGALDSQGTDLTNLTISPYHRQDELGLVVDRTNELLNRIAEQQADLIQREKVAALGSMLAELAHELNNPLAVVTAQAELLAETAKDKETQERAQKILRPAIRSASIVRKFLSLARQRKIEKTVLDVHRLINDAVEMLNYQFTKRNIVVHKKIDADIAMIWGDGAQLGQVLMNILLNAHQALAGCEGDRDIQIHASSVCASDGVRITITDNGPGIPEEIRYRVFQPFFTTKPEGRGTGLGLSLCKSVVEGHGGSITIEEIEPHGTEVVIKLPGTTRKLSDIQVRAHLAQTLTSMRILVVDDEDSLASSIAEVLENYGHTAVTAGSAEQAMALLASERFDIILADVHMPVTDGMTFYRQAQTLDADTAEKFIFITGDSLDPDLVEFFDEQHRPYLTKPFEIGDLVRAIEKLALASGTSPSANESSERLRNV